MISLKKGGGWKFCGCRPEGIDAVIVTCPICNSPFWLRGYKVEGGIVQDVTCGNPLCEFEDTIKLLEF